MFRRVLFTSTLKRHTVLPLALATLSVLLSASVLAGTRDSDAVIRSGPSTGQTAIDVRNYFPRPPYGTVLINEFSHRLDGGGLLRATIQRYRQATMADKNTYYLEDYVITEKGLEWKDTWVYTVDSTGVMEIMDSLEGGYCDQREAPLNHGLYLVKGRIHSNTSRCIHTSTLNGAKSTFFNNYSIFLEDVKVKVSLPAGEFFDVAVQDEQQLICAAGECDKPILGKMAERYRFYFAPGMGIIAQQWLDTSWMPKEWGFFFLSKTCTGDLNKFECK